MDFGKVEYLVFDGNGAEPVSLWLTLIGQGDEETLRREGLAGLRRKRIMRLTQEAEEQGQTLSYEDLCNLLLSSLATVKRDVHCLESQGIPVVLKGRRRGGNGLKGKSGESPE